MKNLYLGLAAALLATSAGAAQAAGSIGLSTNYTIGSTISPVVSEASAVAYNWDTGKLLVVGDENRWGEYSLEGVATPGNILTSFDDPEGLTYIGNGQFVVTQERNGTLYRMTETASGNPRRYTTNTTSPSFRIPGAGNANTGLEGVAFERTSGDYYAVREAESQGIWRISGLDFGAGTPVVEQLFDIEAKLGLETLSDIAVLSNPDAFAGLDFIDNLLILSATSNVLLEVTKAGDVVSSLDLSTTGLEKIEGVTLDNDGNIYLVGEGSVIGRAGLLKLERNVAAVPEPATWAMMIAGFGLTGGAMRRRSVKVAFA